MLLVVAAYNRVVDSRMVDNRVKDNRVVDIRVKDNRVVDNWVAHSRVIDNRGVDSRVLDSRSQCFGHCNCHGNGQNNGTCCQPLCCLQHSRLSPCCVQSHCNLLSPHLRLTNRFRDILQQF